MRFRFQLLHVNPFRIHALCAIGNDACGNQRFGQHPEDIFAILEFVASLCVVVGLADRITHPLPIQPEVFVYHQFLTDLHEMEKQKFEKLCRPTLDPVALYTGEVTDRFVGPDFPELVIESFARHEQ